MSESYPMVLSEIELPDQAARLTIQLPERITESVSRAEPSDENVMFRFFIDLQHEQQVLIFYEFNSFIAARLWRFACHQITLNLRLGYTIKAFYSTPCFQAVLPFI